MSLGLTKIPAPWWGMERAKPPTSRGAGLHSEDNCHGQRGTRHVTGSQMFWAHVRPLDS